MNNDYLDSALETTEAKELESLLEGSLEEQWASVILAGTLNYVYDTLGATFDKYRPEKGAKAEIGPRVSKKLEDYIIEAVDSNMPDIKTLVTPAIIASYLLFVADNIGQETLDTFLSGTFKLTNTDVKKAISERASSLLKGLDKTTKNRIAGEIFRGLKEGTSKTDLAKRLMEINPKISKGRAGTIAVTETNAAIEYIKHEIALQNGVSWKTWHAVIDQKTGKLDASLHLQTAKVGEDFGSSGVSIPPIHPNCFHKDTDILTEDGWKNITEVTTDDSCLSVNPKNIEEVNYIKVAKTISHFSEKLLLLETNDFSTAVTENHNIFVHKYANVREYTKFRADSLPTNGVIPRALFGVLPSKEGNPLNIRDIDFCILLGRYLANGRIPKRWKGSLLLGEYLAQLNGGIPKEIKKMSLANIRSFIKAYGIRNTYISSSIENADSIGELLILMGEIPIFSFVNNEYYVTRWYSDKFTSIEGIIKNNVTYNDIVHCVELEKFHTLIIRFNGKVSISGNCRCELYYEYDMSSLDSMRIKGLYDTSEKTKLSFVNPNNLWVGGNKSIGQDKEVISITSDITKKEFRQMWGGDFTKSWEQLDTDADLLIKLGVKKGQKYIWSSLSEISRNRLELRNRTETELKFAFARATMTDLGVQQIMRFFGVSKFTPR